MVGVGCFLFRENVILYVFVLLNNAVVWVSFIRMGSCLVVEVQIHRIMRKKLFQFFRRGFSRKKKVMLVVGLTDNLILWVVGLNSN